MKEEDLINKRKRLIFRSWHRGTKEMDLLLGTFADHHVHGFNEDQLDQYEALLTINDPDLYNWVTGNEEPPANIDSEVFQMFKSHKYPAA